MKTILNFKGERFEMKTKMKRYPVRDIPNDQYRALRIKAAENETSINKAILAAIKEYLEKEKKKNE